MGPPPEQRSHDSQPAICSILLIVVPGAEAEVGVGDGALVVVLGEVAVVGGGGAAGVVLDGAVGAVELARAGVVLAWVGLEAEPPHPASAVTRNARRRIRIRAGGTGRISQF